MESGSYTLRATEEVYSLTVEDLDQIDLVKVTGGWHLLTKDLSLFITKIEIDLASQSVELVCDGHVHLFKISDPIRTRIMQLGLAKLEEKVIDQVMAPMPGLVLEVLVAEGDSVALDQPLVVLQAMKMENLIKSPIDGVIDTIPIEAGETVEKNEILIGYVKP